jgi:hypothetical protein
VRAWIKDRVGSLSVYSDAKELKDDDVRRLALLNPYSLKRLLQSNDRPLIATCFPLLEELIVIRRTTASCIPRDFTGKNFFNIRDLVKPHHMRTRKLERTTEEEAEFQWLHRDAAM